MSKEQHEVASPQPEAPEVNQTLAVEEKKTQATLLVEAATSVELFHTPERVVYGSVLVRGHRETYALNSSGFREWLALKFYIKNGRPPHEQAVKDAIGVLKAKAMFVGKEHEVSVRLSGTGDAVFIDLGDEDWRVLQIDASGIRVSAGASVKFRRPKGMLSLPLPAESGSLDDLRPFVNLRDDDQWRLLVAWLLGAMAPTGPYPILEITGEQGSAKSTLSKLLRGLLDPNSAPARATITKERDLMIAATNGRVLVFDNVSRLSAELSDALCRISTGGGFSVRTLYENADETLFEAELPIILNGIEDISHRPDLLERTIVLDLPVLTPGQRRDEQQFWADFEAAKPAILRGLYEAVRSALQNRPLVAGAKWPRMADFAKWVTAAESALGWTTGAFLESYERNRTEANTRILERDGLAEALIQLAGKGEPWEGTATELLAVLRSPGMDHNPDLPRSPNALSGGLRRITPSLRSLGVSIEFHRKGHASQKVIRLRPISEFTDRTDRTDREEPLAA